MPLVKEEPGRGRDTSHWKRPDPFDLSDQKNLGPRWEEWAQDLNDYLEGIEEDREGFKMKLLLNIGGTELKRLVRKLVPEDNMSFRFVMAALEKQFVEVRNVDYERHAFHQARQGTAESVDEFAVRLRGLVKHCDFERYNNEDAIRAQIIQGCLSASLRRHLLKKPIPLSEVLEIARVRERVECQAKEMEEMGNQKKEFIAAIARKPWRPREQGEKKGDQDKEGDPKNKCYRCGYDFPHRGKCPALGQTCHECGRENHLQRVCGKFPRQRQAREPDKRPGKQQIRYVQEEESAVNENSGRDREDSPKSVDSYTYGDVNMMREESDDMTSLQLLTQIDGRDVTVTVDTGATSNVIDAREFDGWGNRPTLTSSDIRMFRWGDRKPMLCRGKFRGKIAYKGKEVVDTFHVIEADRPAPSLLSLRTARMMGIVQLNFLIEEENEVAGKFPGIFKGLGKMKGVTVSLHINETVKPVAQHHRRVAFHMQGAVAREIEDLLALDIIEEAEGPTPWVSPLVVVPKDGGKVRLCVDMRQPNEAIERERHPGPHITDMIIQLNGAQWFSKLDLNKGYHQIALDHKSRYITTFSTHLGLYRYKRLSFGISSAAEIFQELIRRLLLPIANAFNYSDDILVFGETKRSHDESLENVCQQLVLNDLTLNRAKCEFHKKELRFYGHVFSEKGMHPDPDKVRALHMMEAPKDVGDVRSFLGMASYCARYIQDFATISAPLRELTKQGMPFEWSNDCDQAFRQIKCKIGDAEHMAYFDPEKETVITVDASPVGLGAIMAQHPPGNEDTRRVVSYASRSLTKTEAAYSQPEKESLAVVWACEHYHLFIFGKRFTIVTDHQALLSIFGNARAKMPPRIERWGIRLQEYDYIIKHKPGKEQNPADYMSRHPLPLRVHKTNVADQYINFLVREAVPPAMSVEEIAAVTKNDRTMQAAIMLTNESRWKSMENERLAGGVDMDEMKAIKMVSDELAVSDNGILIRGTRIVVPQCLRKRMIDTAHEGHRGIVATKKMLRDRLWFPQMDKLTEQILKSCHTCQCLGGNSPPEPLEMSPLPEGVWRNVAIDFFGPLKSSRYLMAVMDEYSRFPVVKQVASTGWACVVPALDDIFSAWGIPEILKSDNGPPFNGEEFRRFAEYMGFTHRRITPRWPQANGMIERFMATLKRAVQRAQLESKGIEQTLCQTLRDYRTTPHGTTDRCPAELMFGRKVKTRLPCLEEKQTKDEELRRRDSEAKAKMKEHADSKRKSKGSDIAVGDWVLLRQQLTQKSDSNFNRIRLKVTDKKGSMVTVEGVGRPVTRNVSHFKRWVPQANEVPELDTPFAGVTGMAVPSHEQNERTNEMPNVDSDNRAQERVPRVTKKPQRLIEEME